MFLTPSPRHLLLNRSINCVVKSWLSLVGEIFFCTLKPPDVDSDLNFLRFNADLEWVKFIIMNRTHSLPNSKSFKQDIIYGPIADGRLFTVIRDVKHGKMTLNEALIKMKPNAYAKQYCLKTKKALLHLKFIGKEYF